MKLFDCQTRGIIPIYKPKGPTSHDIIYKLRRITGEKKIGHAGTLDPLASGILVVGIGKDATRKLSIEVAKEKEYLATIKLGVISATDDEEGEKTENNVKEIPGLEKIKKVVDQFKGEIDQIPPIYSSIKIHGQSAHRLVRKGIEVKLEPRKVLIKDIQIVDFFWPEIKIRVVTGPGVYIRSLARDIGEKLSTGAYMSDLERMRVGEFTKDKAFEIEGL